MTLIFKVRSKYLRGPHRASVYRWVNCCLCVHLCGHQLLEARAHTAFCVQAGGRGVFHRRAEEFRGNGAPSTLCKSASRHKGREDEYSRILISFCVIYILLSLDRRLPTCPGVRTIIASHITFLLHCEEDGRRKEIGEEKWTGLLG